MLLYSNTENDPQVHTWIQIQGKTVTPTHCQEGAKQCGEAFHPTKAGKLNEGSGIQAPLQMLELPHPRSSVC